MWHDQWRVYANGVRVELRGKNNIKKEWAEDTDPEPLNIWGAYFRIIFLHAVINSIVGALFVLNGNLHLTCGSHILGLFFWTFIFHLIGLLMWYGFELTIEQEIEKRMTDKEERRKKKLYIYFIPLSLFFSLLLVAVSPAKAVLLPILISGVFFVTYKAKVKCWFTTNTPTWLTKFEDYILKWRKRTGERKKQ